jgi:hypothetical protein
MSIVRKHVAQMNEADRRQIIVDQSDFERDGSIGDCVLRDTAEFLMDKIGVGIGGVVTWMTIIVMEVYRYYTFQHFAPNIDDVLYDETDCL